MSVLFPIVRLIHSQKLSLSTSGSVSLDPGYLLLNILIVEARVWLHPVCKSTDAGNSAAVVVQLVL